MSTLRTAGPRRLARLLPLLLVLPLLTGPDTALAATSCRWQSERVCHVLHKAQRMARQAHHDRAGRPGERLDYAYTTRQRRAVQRRPVIDLAQPQRYRHPRRQVRTGGHVRHHAGRAGPDGRSFACRTRWWRFEEESLVFHGTLYRTRFTVRWCWWTEGRARIFDVLRDWDIYDLDTTSINVGHYREDDSAFVPGTNRTWYHVDEVRQVQNCVLHYGCILGSAYPRVQVTMIAGAWTGGLVRTS